MRRSPIKVTLDGLFDISLQFIDGACLRKDRVAESASFISAFRGLLHAEDNLGFGHVCATDYTFSPLREDP